MNKWNSKDFISEQLERRCSSGLSNFGFKKSVRIRNLPAPWVISSNSVGSKPKVVVREELGGVVRCRYLGISTRKSQNVYGENIEKSVLVYSPLFVPLLFSSIHLLHWRHACFQDSDIYIRYWGRKVGIRVCPPASFRYQCNLHQHDMVNSREISS